MKRFVPLTFGDYDLQLMKTTKSMSNQAFDIILIWSDAAVVKTSRILLTKQMQIK